MTLLCLNISQIIFSSTSDIIMSKLSKWIFLHVQCIVFMVISEIYEKTTIFCYTREKYKYFFASNILRYSPPDGQGCFSFAANRQSRSFARNFTANRSLSSTLSYLFYSQSMYENKLICSYFFYLNVTYMFFMTRKANLYY